MGPNDTDTVDVGQLSTNSLKALRERIGAELDARRRENADDPEDIVDACLEDAREYLRGRKKMGKSPNVGPAIEIHNGVIVSVCYKGDTSRKNSVSRWLKVNGDWVWESDRVVAEETEYADFGRGYIGKVSVFALGLRAGDEVEIHNKETHGSGSNRRTLYDFDGVEFQEMV